MGVIAVVAVVAWAALAGDSSDPGAGPARHHPLHGMRDAVRAMVGDALAEQGAARHPRLRRVAGSRGREHEDGEGPGSPEA
ncbi:hypothetical protein ACFY04_21510 [Streptomyces sp. NPDC001549]|uniref:hypothetical protein n=1 Tax=Streptomyces sp. NPDC001549 TaxID=3364586 RepID=UPI0036B1B036